MAALVLMLFGTVPSPSFAVHTSVDLVEVSHVYDDKGDLVFDQVIFYDWTPKESRYNVRAWRLVKDHRPFPTQLWLDKVGRDVGVYPAKGPYRSDVKVWRCMWLDGDVSRNVTARAFRETWSQDDPELTEREFLPKEKRKEL